LVLTAFICVFTVLKPHDVSSRRNVFNMAV
jgi:hypothetical protein